MFRPDTGNYFQVVFHSGISVNKFLMLKKILIFCLGLFQPYPRGLLVKIIPIIEFRGLKPYKSYTIPQEVGITSRTELCILLTYKLNTILEKRPILEPLFLSFYLRQ